MPTTLITGAAGALGSALTRLLHARGHRVAAVDVPAARTRLETLAAELGGGALAVPLDVSSSSDWTAALARVEKEIGPLDGAVLTAGGWQGGAPFHAEPDPGTWQAMMSTNLETAQRSLRALLPGMVARGQGSVVLIGSRAAQQPWTSGGAAAYAASKAAVVALGQAVAAEVSPSGVRVNAVLPSIIDTQANRAGMPGADFSTWVAPESLSAVIAFLLSADARDVSGAAIPVYGRA